MDPSLIVAITSLSALSIGIFGKILYTLRHNVKSCWGIVFRSENSSSNISPRERSINTNIELNQIKQKLQQITPIQNISSSELEEKLRVRELEIKLKEADDKLKELENEDRVYI